jgi:predicted DsbA family dithiol-disulfide isomerase
MSLEDYFGPERARQIKTVSPVQRLAAELGLTMRGDRRLINSRRALAAAEVAREQGKFEAMHKALFRAYWEGTHDLTSIDDLCALGESVGLDPALVRSALEEGRYEDLIDANRREAEQVGINAIPAHIFGLRYLVVGAQPYEVLREVVDKLSEA